MSKVGDEELSNRVISVRGNPDRVAVHIGAELRRVVHPDHSLPGRVDVGEIRGGRRGLPEVPEVFSKSVN